MSSLGPQFDPAARVQEFKTAKSIPGHEAPVFYPNYSHQYVRNPLASHIPPSVQIDHGDGSYTNVPQHGLPGYDPTAIHERIRGVTQIPLERLESTQGYISKTHVNNMKRRKGEAPPVEVTHYVDQDRYVLGEGNHRAMVAHLRGDTHIPAEVTHRREWNPERRSPR